MFYFLWLNDTTPDRHYWCSATQSWAPEWAKATRWTDEADAIAEAEKAGRTTKAEVVVQAMQPA